MMTGNTILTHRVFFGRPIFFFVFVFLFVFSAGAQVTASFTSNLNAGCMPLLVQFINNSTGSPTSYFWNLGNGNTSTNANPQALYTTPGLKTVILIASDGTSSDTATMTITVYDSPVVSFSANPSTGCNPFEVCFTNNSQAGSGSISSVVWDFGDGVVDTAFQPCHLYTINGHKDVTLIVTNSFGCQANATVDSAVVVYPVPVAAFSVAQTTPCQLPVQATFTNNSTGSNLNYYWDFGDGNFSTQAAPVHSYVQQGIFPVMLVVTSQQGCSDTLALPGAVSAGSVNASFVIQNPVVCLGDTVRFSQTSSGNPVSFSWFFGGGGTGTGPNPFYVYSNPGSYHIYMVAQFANGCSDTVVQLNGVQVLPSPSVNFSASATSGCILPFPVTFSASGSGAATLHWDFGDGTSSNQISPTHNYNSTGVFTVTLTAVSAAGCSTVVTQANLIDLTGPQANFAAYPSSGCAPLQVNFSDSSFSSSPITNWNWNFGNGATSNLQNPTAFYPNTGVFPVTLTITTANGCTDSITQLVLVGDTPVVNFGWSDTLICANDQISFYDSSSSTVNQWLWDFGDGSNPSTDQNPDHVYSNPGVFTVTLTVFENGCPNTMVIPNLITVLPPKPEFSFVVNCDSPFTVIFTDLSIGAHRYLWDFGDSLGTSVIPSPAYIYADTGSYSVSLTVINDSTGCFSTRTVPVRIMVPTADFYASDTVLCRREVANLYNVSGSIGTTYWEIPSGVFHSTSPVTPRSFINPGFRSVTMINCDPNGCCDTLTKVNYLGVYGSLPAFSASPRTGCAPLQVQFTDLTNPPISTISQWLWDFGDGNTSTDPNPIHTYIANGSYTVRLWVTDTAGCIDSVVYNQYINVTAPHVHFSTPDSLYCPGQTVQFSDSVVGAVVSLLWLFGDGDSSQISNPAHVYSANGIYTVTLFATDTQGCVGQFSRDITISSPVVGFDADTLFANCPPLLVGFYDTSQYGLPAVAWNWSFGNGASGNSQNPSNIYTTPGSFDVELIVTFSNGCTDSAQIPDFVVLNGPTGNLQFFPPVACTPATICFNANSVFAISHIWDFGNGNVAFGADTICHTYLSPGIFNPEVVLTDSLGCTNVLTAPDSLVIDEPVASFVATPLSGCVPLEVDFSFTGNAIAPFSVIWDFGDGFFDSLSGQQVAHTYTNPGVYQATVIMENAFLCRDTFGLSITVHQLPDVAFAPSDTSVCLPAIVSFQDNSQSSALPLSWFWNFGNGFSDTISSPFVLFDSAGLYSVQLVVTDANGCTDSAFSTIEMLPRPVFTSFTDTSICRGDTIQLFGQTGANSHQWLPGSFLSDANDANPLGFPDSSVVWTVVATNVLGCADTQWIQVSVLEGPPLQLSVNDTLICRGDTLTVSITGGVSHSWQPAFGLSQPFSSITQVFPDTSTTYFIIGQNLAGCNSFAQLEIRVSAPSVSIPDSAMVCMGEPVFLIPSAISPMGANLIWQTGAGNSFQADSFFYNYPADGIYTAIVVATDSVGCTSADSARILVAPLPIAAFLMDTVLCQGNELTPLDFSSGSGLSYIWNPGNGEPEQSVSNPVFLVPDSGQFTMWLWVESDFGCSDSVFLDYQVYSVPSVTLGDVSVCLGQEAEFMAGVQSFWLVQDYLWDFGAGQLNTNTDSAFWLFNQAGSFSVSVLVTDVNGCAGTDTALATIFQLPEAGFSTVAQCVGISALLNGQIIPGSGSVSNYSWVLEGLPVSNGPNFLWTPDSSGIYQLTFLVVDDNLCADTASGQIWVSVPPQAFAFPDTVICPGATVTIFGGGGDQILWQPGTWFENPEQPVQQFQPTESATFSLIAANEGCPSDTAEVLVIMADVPEINLVSEVTVLLGLGVELPLETSANSTFLWSPSTGLDCADCQNPIASPVEDLLYSVAVENEAGCRSEGEIFVRVITDCHPELIFVPNTFTPNGDNMNDVLFARKNGIAEITSLKIFDRWGKLQFEGRGENEGWDGTNFNGKKLNPGVFVYIAEGVCHTGQTVLRRGNVTLIK